MSALTWSGIEKLLKGSKLTFLRTVAHLKSRVTLSADRAEHVSIVAYEHGTMMAYKRIRLNILSGNVRPNSNWPCARKLYINVCSMVTLRFCFPIPLFPAGGRENAIEVDFNLVCILHAAAWLKVWCLLTAWACNRYRDNEGIEET